jgi:hypothetical protein
MVINISYIPNTSYPDDDSRIFLRNLDIILWGVILYMTTVCYLLSLLPQAERLKASVQATAVSKYHTLGDGQVLQLVVFLLFCRHEWPFCWGYGWRSWDLKDALIKKYIGLFLQHGYWQVTSAIKHQSSPNVKKSTVVYVGMGLNLHQIFYRQILRVKDRTALRCHQSDCYLIKRTPRQHNKVV